VPTTVNPAAPAIVVVVNPRALHGPCGVHFDAALGALRAATEVTLLETQGAGGDVARIGAVCAARRPELVVAAGGDGTLRDVAEVLRAVAPGAAPALGILPLGTANNVARSLGLASFRQHGAPAVGAAVAALLAGAEQRLDLGEVDGRCFVGSFAVGMDADILVARNRWRRRFDLGRRIGGYPLYLTSCAVNLARCRAVAATVELDGQPARAPLYNLLVANTALYAGEFRFDGADHSADGRLDVHLFGSAGAYVSGFAAAWRRHLAERRGAAVEPPPGLQRIAHATIELAAPCASQLDGEEHSRAARFEVRVLPSALRVRVPA
jgi:diacylglycerol kinase family enzyme